ncbi:hypothetical protein D3C81_2183470 [compost metagenome]
MVVLGELVFMGVGRQAVDMHLARFGNPQDMAVVAVFMRCEHTSQFINSRLIVQIHVKAP